MGWLLGFMCSLLLLLLLLLFLRVRGSRGGGICGVGLAVWACDVGVVVRVLGDGGIEVPCYYEEFRWGNPSHCFMELFPELLFGLFLVFVVWSICCYDVYWGFCGFESCSE